MTLTKCPECQHEVSPKAKSCPQCAHPIKPPAVRRQTLLLFALLLVVLSFGGFSTTFARRTMPESMYQQIALACAVEKLPQLALLALSGADVDAEAMAAECLPTWAKAMIYSGKTGSIPGAGGGLVRTTHEKASMAAMKSNLRNLAAAQIVYFDERGMYGSSIQQIDARIASDVRIVLTHVSATGYRATASHDSLPGVRCYAVVGSAATADDDNGEGFPWCDDRRR